MDEKKALEKEYAKRMDYVSLFTSETGNRVLNDLMANHCVLTATLASDSHRTAFNEGQRNVVLRILNMIIKDPTDVLDRIRQIESEQKKYADMERAMNDY